MNRVELLAPAGSFESLKAAVQNGCDALYLGASAFGARAYADNFNDETLHEAITYAHMYGVRVFVTMNTLIKDDEMPLAIAQAKRLQELDVDALIIQDFGFFQMLRKVLPDMELHASTQMHIHNEQGIRFLKECGAKRVVLPRETPIEDIRKYAKEGVDLEVFVQGALCISYSGQCLMSAKTLHRSGNRGECAQSCRMQYTLEKEEQGVKTTIEGKGKYILSPKDLNTLANIPQLIQAGITSFKIEGRMKRPEYVALMCSCYRKAIDAFYEGRIFHVDAHMQEEMEKIFNRGFTSGLLFHQQGSSLMNALRPNHMGVVIGKVEAITKDKMRIHLSKELRQGDGIRVLNEREDEGFRANMIYHNGLLVNHAKANDHIELKKEGFISKGATVVKTSDREQLATLRHTFSSYQRKVTLHACFQMHKNKYAQLCIYDDEGHSLEINSEVLVEKALKTPLDKHRLETQIKKCGDCAFVIEDIIFDIDEDATMPIKEVNQMRRNAMEQIGYLRSIRNGKRQVRDDTLACTTFGKHIGFICIVHTKEQFLACHKCGISYIFVEDDTLYHQLIAEGYSIYHRASRVMKERYMKQLELVNEHGALYKQHGGADFICDTSLNVTNIHSVSALLQHGAMCVTLSHELDCTQAISLFKNFIHTYHHEPSIAYPVYGRVELMISQYCPIHTICVDNDKKNCTLCRGKARYALIDMKKHRYPLLNDAHCRMRLYDEYPENNIKDIKRLKEIGVSNYVCTFTLESAQEVERILKEGLSYAA